MSPPRLRLGQLLVDAKLITAEALAEVLEAQRSDPRRIGTLLVERGLINETQLTQILSHQLSVPWVSLLHIEFSRQLLNLVPHDVADRYCLVPIYVRHVRSQGDTLYVAMEDPSNEEGLRACREHAGLPVRAMIAPPADIRSAIRVYYGIEPTAAPARVAPPAVEAAPAPHDALPTLETAPVDAALAEATLAEAEAADAEAVESPVPRTPPTVREPAMYALPSEAEVQAFEPAPHAEPPAEEAAAAEEPAAEPAVEEPAAEPAVEEPAPGPAAEEPEEEAREPVRDEAPAAPAPVVEGPDIEAVEIPVDVGRAARLRALLDAPPASPTPSEPPAEIPRPRGRAPRMVSLTLLDGTTLNLPAKRRSRERAAASPSAPPPSSPSVTSEPPGPEEVQALTARDLILALRVVAHGADASEVLGSNVRWESLFSALLSLLLKKHLIADWEFVDELKKTL
jgi:type IV pilus assembly protein PilB